MNRRRALILTLLLSSAAPALADDAPPPGRVAYDRGGNIYTAERGSGETVVVKDGDCHTPRWSPDGKRILFIRNTSLQTLVNDDGSTSEIGQPTDFYIVDRNGDNMHLVRHLDGVVSDPTWSPDGKTIGFFYQSKEEWLHEGMPGFQSGFFEMPVKGMDPPRLISTDARSVDWSPNGKKLVFTVDRPGDHFALHTANVDGGDETQLLDEEIFVNADHAKWSPDGSQIAFQALVRHKLPDNKFAFQSTIFTVHPDGTHIRQLTYDLGWDCWHPWWMPDKDNMTLTYYCYAMPGCTPAIAKASPEQCIGRTFTVDINDPHAKPEQTAEQQGIAGGVIPQVAPK
jgi:Tol biopolymer transport system component